MWRPGKSFRVGAMRERINVQSYTSTRDASGQPVASWTNTLTGEPARFLDLRGGASYRGEQLQETTAAVFEVRYRDTYKPDMRIVWDGETFNIHRVARVDGGRRYLALHATAVVA